MVRTVLAALCLALVAGSAGAEPPAAKPPRVPIGTARANAREEFARHRLRRHNDHNARAKALGRSTDGRRAADHDGLLYGQ